MIEAMLIYILMFYWYILLPNTTANMSTPVKFSLDSIERNIDIQDALYSCFK